MIRYAITDRRLLAVDEATRQQELLRYTARWAAQGLDLVQLREKDLPAADLANLGRKMLHLLRGRCKLLVNSRLDVAVAIGADGVHLTSAAGELTPQQVRQLYAASGLRTPLVSVSTHSVEQTAEAVRSGADYVLFGPVFEKSVAGSEVSGGVGIPVLRDACAAAGAVPVLALGGVTPQRIYGCLQAGASGVAGIRLFLDT